MTEFITKEEAEKIYYQCSHEDLDAMVNRNIMTDDEFHRAINLAIAQKFEVRAYLVDGRIEQGLGFDKEAAEAMANANCGTVLPLYTLKGDSK